MQSEFQSKRHLHTISKLYGGNKEEVFLDTSPV